MPTPHTVFISYAHADYGDCRPYYEALRNMGLDVWIDQNEVTGGTDLYQRIEEELQQRTALLVFFTPAALASDSVKNEWIKFLPFVKPEQRLLLPIILKPCSVPMPLNHLAWIDATGMTFEQTIGQLARALHVPHFFPAGPPVAAKELTLSVNPGQVELAGANAIHHHSDSLTALAWSPNGDYLATASSRENSVHIWNPQTGETIHQLDLAFIDAIDWARTRSPDTDNSLMLATDVGTHIQLWKIPTCQPFAPTIQRRHEGRCVAWSPDGHYVAFDEDEEVAVVDLMKRYKPSARRPEWALYGRITYPGHKFNMQSFLRSVEAGKRRSMNNPIQLLCWSPDSTRIASVAGGDELHIWNANRGTTIIEDQLEHFAIKQMAWSPDGTRIALAHTHSLDGSYDKRRNFVSLLAVHNLNLVQVFSCRLSWLYAISGLSWSPDGKYLAAEGDEGVLYIWEVLTGQVVRQFYCTTSLNRGMRMAIEFSAWSPSGNRLALATNHGEVHVLDLSE